MVLNRFRFTRFMLAAVFILLTLATDVPTNELRADENLLSPTQIRAAMHSERSNIVSGKFIANGRYSQSALNKVERSYTFSWKYEFDLIQGSFLFDQSQTVPANPDTRGSDSELLRIFFCEDKTSQYTYEDYVIPSALLYKRGINDSTTELKSQFQRLDVRGLGFYNLESIIQMSHKGDKAFFESNEVSIDDIQVEQESQDILKLWYEQSATGPQYKICLWVDSKKGFTPIRRVTYLNGQVEEDFNTDWELVNEEWVPRKLTGIGNTPFLPDGKELTEENIAFRTQEFEMDISWSEVNEFTSPASYDFKSFDFPKGTQVVEAGQLVHVYGHELPSSPEAPNTRKLSKYLIALSAAAVVLLMFYGYRVIKVKK